METVLTCLPFVLGGLWGVYCAHKRYGLLVLVIGAAGCGAISILLKSFIRSLL